MTTWFFRASFGPWIAAKQFLLLQSLLRVAVAAGAVTMSGLHSIRWRARSQIRSLVVEVDEQDLALLPLHERDRSFFVAGPALRPQGVARSRRRAPTLPAGIRVG